MKFYIEDYDKTATELIVKYEYWEDHPGYPASDWRAEVDDRDTKDGYWSWVVSRLGFERDELDRDNPYNAGLTDA